MAEKWGGNVNLPQVVRSGRRAHRILLLAAQLPGLCWLRLVVEVSPQDIVGGEHNVCCCKVDRRHNLGILGCLLGRLALPLVGDDLQSACAGGSSCCHAWGWDLMCR